jgi:hypothetical protein
VSDASKALAQLASAITAVRSACADDPDCAHLLSALKTAEGAAAQYGKEEAGEPTSLKEAESRARQTLAQRRSEASSTASK